MNTLGWLKENIGEFESIIRYTYHNRNNIILAFTHSSYANECKNSNLTSNERLEFLGDSVLNLAISEKIYRDYTKLTEGEMTRVRANIVCESSLMKCANNIGIGRYLLLGKGEELTGGRNRISILSDAFEAVIGSIYIDGGMDNAKKFIYTQMERLIEDSVKGIISMDYKTQLQEIIQKIGDKKVIYEIVEEKGPDHSKMFVSQVKIGDEVMGTGEGKSKKEAEQCAAKIALERCR